MLAGPQPFSLRLDRPLGPGFRAGALLSVQVLERLEAGRWLVSIRGRRIPVSAEVPLEPGARLLARVMVSGGRFLLRVTEPAVRPEAFLAPAPADRIAAAFLAAGLNPRPEEVQKVRRLLERLRLPPQGHARLAVMMLQKGMDLDSPGVAELLADLAYGQSGGRGRRQARPWPGKPERLAEELRGRLRRSGGGQTAALPLFNHLQIRPEQWFVIPYDYGEVSGSIRLRRHSPAAEADRLVLTTDGPWSFVLNRNAGGYRLQAICAGTPPGARAQRGWRRLAQKLQNLGVETDDTIRGDEGFDGFSLPGEAGPYQRVDTEG
jgi:hypothetical protein